MNYVYTIYNEWTKINKQKVKRVLHGMAASHRHMMKSQREKTMAQMELPDIDIEGLVVIMIGADRGLGSGMV